MVINKEEDILNRIQLNNNWPHQFQFETPLTENFRTRLRDLPNQQIFVPLSIDEQLAKQLFLKYPRLSRIFSLILDLFDVLPNHPDLAFDIAWRSFEISLEYYASFAWKGINDKFISKSEKASQDIFAPIYTKEIAFRELYDLLIDTLSHSAIRFAVMRTLCSHELSVHSQRNMVSERVKRTISETTLKEFINSYLDEEGNLSIDNERKIYRRYFQLLKGDKVLVDIENGKTKKIKSLSLSERISFLINSILYTSRCERFHGDFQSPFKSGLADLRTYYLYYDLTLICYILFWTVFYKIIDKLDSSFQIVNFRNLQVIVEENLKNMRKILKNN